MADETVPIQLQGKPPWRTQYFPVKPRKEVAQVSICRKCFKDRTTGKCTCGGSK